MSINWTLLPVVVLVSVVEWFAAALNIQRVRYVTKPLSLLLLIVWFSINHGWEGQSFWFGLGLIGSLIGDIALLAKHRFFLTGLLGFLSAHLFYLIGFNPTLPPPRPAILLALAAVIGVAILIDRRIVPGVEKLPKTRRLKIPVRAYGIFISLMLLSAILTWFRPGWNPLTAGLVSLGAALFFASDTILATHQFVRPVRGRGLWVMCTYHLAQFAIVSGVLLQYHG